MNPDDKKALKDAIEFYAQLTSAYINGLDHVAREPMAKAAGNHMKTIVEHTQIKLVTKEEK